MPLPASSRSIKQKSLIVLLIHFYFFLRPNVVETLVGLLPVGHVTEIH